MIPAREQSHGLSVTSPPAILPPYCSITGADLTRFGKQKQKEDCTFFENPVPLQLEPTKLLGTPLLAVR